MNNEEVFKRVKRHLLRQNAKSCGPQSYRYKNKDGTQCAIGCLIPNEIYNEDMESTGIQELIELNPEIRVLFDGVDQDLLIALQEIHDDCHQDTWEVELDNLADQYGFAS